jgi:hypothetical protein
MEDIRGHNQSYTPSYSSTVFRSYCYRSNKPSFRETLEVWTSRGVLSNDKGLFLQRPKSTPAWSLRTIQRRYMMRRLAAHKLSLVRAKVERFETKFHDLQLPEGGDFGALHCQPSTSFERCTKLDLTNEPLLLNRYYYMEFSSLFIVVLHLSFFLCTSSKPYCVIHFLFFIVPPSSDYTKFVFYIYVVNNICLVVLPLQIIDFNKFTFKQRNICIRFRGRF